MNAFVSAPITAGKLDAEVVLKVPRPTNAHLADEVPFLDVAGRRMSLAVVPPQNKYALEAGAGVKVIAGRCACSVPCLTTAFNTQHSGLD